MGQEVFCSLCELQTRTSSDMSCRMHVLESAWPLWGCHLQPDVHSVTRQGSCSSLHYGTSSVVQLQLHTRQQKPS